MTAVRAALFVGLYGAGRLLERAAHEAAQLAYHAAAGLTRLEDVRAAIARQPEADGVVERGEHWVLSGLSPWEATFYSKSLALDERILLVGCGSGRDLLALCERGYRVEGLELVPERAAAARALLARRGLAGDVVAGSIETAPLAGPYDAIVFSWFCYSLIPGAAARVGALRRAAAHLAPGGRMLLSYMRCDRAPRPAAIALGRLVARLSGTDWQPEPGDLVWLSARARVAHYSHVHPPGALPAEAAAAGLAVAFDEPGDVATAVLVAR